MFPSSRNSLRRSSRGGRTVPFPIAVEVKNFLGAPYASSESDEWRWSRPDHTSAVLPPIRLEIFTLQNGSETVVYESDCARPSLHPAWEHLDENIDLPSGWWSHPDSSVYNHLTLRVSVQPCSLDEPMPVDSALSEVLQIEMHPSGLVKVTEPPQFFPPNFCMIYFSDGSVRCEPMAYQILVENNLVEKTVEEHVEEFSRFGDHVFRTLDAVASQSKDDREVESTELQTPSLSEDNESPPTHEVKAFSLDPTSFELSVDEAEIIDFENEKQALESLVATEQKILDDQIASVHDKSDVVRRLLLEAKTLEEQLDDIAAETDSVNRIISHQRVGAHVVREKQRLELCAIYRIVKTTEGNYTINSLRLPSNFLDGSTSVPEDELSAALGYVCHAVELLGKYSSAHFRHPPVSNGSRSFVLGDGATSLPLYLTRAVDRSHLEKAIECLHANLDCLTCNLVAQPADNSNILEKLYAAMHSQRRF